MKRVWYSVSLVIVLLSTFHLSLADELDDGTATAEIRGKIIDSSTKEPLVGANVLVEHTTVGAATNLDGEYRVLLALVGELRLVSSMMGYRAAKKNSHSGIR